MYIFCAIKETIELHKLTEVSYDNPLDVHCSFKDVSPIILNPMNSRHNHTMVYNQFDKPNKSAVLFVGLLSDGILETHNKVNQQW